MDRRQRLQKALGEDGDTLLTVATAKALAGDVGMMALLLPRLMPALKSEGVLVQFELDQDAPFDTQAKAIIAAVAAGQLDLDSAKALFDMIAARVGLQNLDAFLGELRKLKNGGANSPPALPGGVKYLTQD